ncbi:MAG: UDP-N-acetylglucosamine 2-epimerase (non-hydrolyzing) [Firmicutes bacterium]|nr:UDP-N-acetylglucosamine 2-epimerase (non-hydrolyzing) [Bacillota bacterium]
MTPICIKLAPKVGAIDIPKDDRRMHTKPIPRFGGLAMYLGTVTAILLAVPLNEKIIGILAGGTLIFLVGIYDDIKNMSAKVKLLCQIAAALIVFATGTKIAFIQNPFAEGVNYFFLSPVMMGIITVIWIVGITNAINLIDGLDGLAAGTALIASMCMAYGAYLSGNLGTAILMLALAGATLGFLPFNFNPAKIFMGDAGSLFLGFMLASISIETLKGTTLIVTLVPLIALGLPIFDTAFAIIRRAVNGRPIMEADKGHLHHRIMARGMGQKRTAIILYAISGVLGICAVQFGQGNKTDAFFLMIVAAAMIYVFARPVPDGRSQEEIKMEEVLGTVEEKAEGKIRVMSVFGTRPEAIKMAPLVKTLEADEKIESVLCVTAQHREMLDQVLDLFELTPKYDLNIMKPNQTLSMITANVINGLDKIVDAEKPDVILVHGDTTTTFAASLSAFYHKTKIGHVEAGLRTNDKYSPYPEEMNRVMTGHMADFHFAPTENNKKNLLREGISEDSIYITGNTVIDALLEVAGREYVFEEETLKNIDFEGRRVITVTCHRRENLGENMVNIFSAIRDIALKYDDVEIIYPVHLNPAVRKTANEILDGVERVHLIEPLQYQPFVNLMARSYFILTDSGGMQEEAPALGKPVLVVRKETERPEAIAAGTAKLAGVNRDDIFGMACELLDSKEAYEKMSKAVNPYGDGTASAQIAAALKGYFGI